MSPSCPIRNVRPPLVSYSPNIWTDHFSNFSLDHLEQEKYAEAIEALKKDTRSKLLAAKSGELIKLIDIVERLGLAYHFETEIEQKLETIYNNFHGDDETYDLFTTALGFRLLRQHKYHVSCSVFKKFKDEENKFKESVMHDAEGLLSLYEAAHIRIHGEDILEEAVAFTTLHLNRLLSLGLIVSPLKDKVMRALDQPHHRGTPIIEIRVYISIYEKDESGDEQLLKLSKLNFNFLQNLYKNEICELSRWWNKFDLKSKLTYARDRWIECYLWGAALHFEPQYSYVRTIVAKNMQMVSIMDDTYDNYATLEEAQLLTDILERWNMNEIDRLPDYMKTVYQYIMSIYEDYERDATKLDKSFAAPYYRETVKQLSRAYNQEQIWIMERQMPPFEVYMTNSVVTSCIYEMLMSLLPGIESATKQSADWLVSEPKILISTAKLGRHLEDLGSHERENREGKLPTVVDCYMKEHAGVSKQEALAKFRELVENGWKDLNKEWVDSKSSIHKEMVQQLLNYARIAEVTYKNSEDGYTNPEKFLAPQIAAAFVDPFII
ncbi:gamma-cadinene synthase [Phtheirospermum japonicum]|uniref:Gamma-cadinene synthase n=1 Tax=Phtheirospermum japonicum TaxID=374723 RepID=A0A830D089_9LAMI|nr:gamma-cadinene synthase [Phtheirospermum japonicum]